MFKFQDLKERYRYMGSASLKAWIEGIIAAGLAIGLLFLPITVGDSQFVLSILPILFISLRRGMLQGFFAGIVTAIVAVFLNGNADLITNLVNQFGPYAFVGIAGFFAKFTQRTLNNKRFPNAALNIITASVLGTVVSFVWVLIGSVSSDDATLTFTDALKREGLSFLLIAGAAILIFLLLAKVLPQVFIPRDTPFLSRKEKSKLLND